MNETSKLMFEIGIKDIRKSLDTYKKDLEKWVKDNPVKLRVELEGLQDKLRSMGVVFGESNKQIRSLAKELRNTPCLVTIPIAARSVRTAWLNG